MTIRRLIPLLLIPLLGIVACDQSNPVRPSGYLVNYQHLKPTDSTGQTLYFEDKSAPWGSYHSIMFDEVAVRTSLESRGQSISAKDLKKMRNHFQRTLANSACSRLNFTNKPGKGVIMLRTAIVDIKPVNVAANVVSKGLFFVPVDFGKAAIEGELRDSITGQHLASIVDRKFGSFVDPIHSYTTWGAVEDAFEAWSEELGGILDKNLPPEK